jgi:hypothetical protein
MISEIVRLPSYLILRTLRRKRVEVSDDISRFDLIDTVRTMIRDNKIKKEDFDKELELYLNEKKEE